MPDCLHPWITTSLLKVDILNHWDWERANVVAQIFPQGLGSSQLCMTNHYIIAGLAIMDNTNHDLLVNA